VIKTEIHPHSTRSRAPSLRGAEAAVDSVCHTLGMRRAVRELAQGAQQTGRHLPELATLFVGQSSFENQREDRPAAAGRTCCVLTAEPEVAEGQVFGLAR